MSINRTYGDNGKLLRDTLNKELKEREARYHRKQIVKNILNTIAPYALIAVSMTLLTAYYLVLN